MRKFVFALCWALFAGVSVYGGGELELANTQEIGLDGVTDIQIRYGSEKVSLFMGASDALVIKEYMNENNSKYFAEITASGTTVTVENGPFPFRPLLNVFDRRTEVFLPASYKNALRVKSGSGKIEAPEGLACSEVYIENASGSIDISSITAAKTSIKNASGSITVGEIYGDASLESASGSIRGETIRGNASMRANSGSITVSAVDGDVSAETDSGAIALHSVTGSVAARTSSGAIRCTAAGTAGDLSLASSSGSVRLNLPKAMRFNFSARTSSGSVKTPFPEQLAIPVSDRRVTQGVIGGGASENIPSVAIATNSGSIRIDWAD